VPTSYPGYEEGDHAQVNFFYSIINDDDPVTGPKIWENTNPFLDTDDPWLYDRAAAMQVGYLRSGYLRFLREAVRNADFYRQQLWRPADCNGGGCVGAFKFKNPDASEPYPDAKYSYNESMALSYWLTGDTEALPQIEEVTKPYDDFPNNVNPNFYTERHIALKLMANTVAYEVTGKPEYRDKMLVVLNAMRNDQLHPFDGGPVDGGIWQTIRAHEGDDLDTPVVSPWMTALISDAAARTYMVTENPVIRDLLIGLANHECGVGSYMTGTIRDKENPLREQSGGAEVRLPHYLSTRDGLGVTNEYIPTDNKEHAPEVGAVVAWGSYFAGLNGDAAKAASLATCANEFYTTWSHVITSRTHPNAPTTTNTDAFGVFPPRKYGWWFKNSGSFAWAMGH
jgi:hypothetical protein